ncbi:uncharacterized protein LOC122481289 isoform X2 [Prionailurus bengalensis]|nr:uncharacterized protein LOC122481289 isoform X2 [Prionailurus bengalensis]
MEGKRLPEGHMRQKPMPGRPKMQNPPRRGPLADPETGVTSVSYSSSDCTKKADKDKRLRSPLAVKDPKLLVTSELESLSQAAERQHIGM